MKNEKITNFSILDYNSKTLLTWNYKDVHIQNRIKHAVLGLVDENGEIAKVFKKVVGYGRELDKTLLTEELGDYLYFLTRLMDETGLLNDQEFWEAVDKEVHKQTEIIKEASGTDYCLMLTKITYLIGTGFGSMEYRKYLMTAILYLKRFCLYAGTNLATVAKANNKKLEHRHKGSYNPNNLEDRNPEEEKKIIEST